MSHEVGVDPVDDAGIDISQLRLSGAHSGAQKMIFSRFALKKAARVDRSDASAELTFLMNGAKETRTPDPLHRMHEFKKLSTGFKS